MESFGKRDRDRKKALKRNARETRRKERADRRRADRVPGAAPAVVDGGAIATKTGDSP